MQKLFSRGSEQEAEQSHSQLQNKAGYNLEVDEAINSLKAHHEAVSPARLHPSVTTPNNDTNWGAGVQVHEWGRGISFKHHIREG